MLSQSVSLVGKGKFSFKLDPQKVNIEVGGNVEAAAGGQLTSPQVENFCLKLFV